MAASAMRISLLRGIETPWWRIVRSMTTLSGTESTAEPTEELQQPQRRARIYEDGEHSIKPSQIPNPAWSVIWRLKKHGHEAFFVGGTVRDLCINQTPKDVDIVTSAELHEVKRMFNQCAIIGKRFPICLVMMASEQIEVSSFSTSLGERMALPSDLDKAIHSYKIFEKKLNGDEKGRLPITWACVRYWNAISRDFSVNALMYEPCTQLLFDYVNGYQDLKAKRLRCLKDPAQSFQEDPARILRGIRFAARLGFSIDDQMSQAMQENAKLLENVPQSRVQFELNTILTYGSCADAFRLMWKHGVLDWLLPRHANYLTAKRYPRDAMDKSDYLFTVLEAFDRSRRTNKVLDEPTIVVMVTAPILAHDVQRLRNRLRSKPTDEKNVDEDLELLRRQKENVAFVLLTKSLLNLIPQTAGGGMVFTHTAIHKALIIFKRVKQRHIYEAHEVKMMTPVRNSEESVVRVLESKELKWKERSNLGLAIVDPTERSFN